MQNTWNLHATNFPTVSLDSGDFTSYLSFMPCEAINNPGNFTRNVAYYYSRIVDTEYSHCMVIVLVVRLK